MLFSIPFSLFYSFEFIILWAEDVPTTCVHLGSIVLAVISSHKSRLCFRYRAHGAVTEWYLRSLPLPQYTSRRFPVRTSKMLELKQPFLYWRILKLCYIMLCYIMLSHLNYVGGSTACHPHRRVTPSGKTSRLAVHTDRAVSVNSTLYHVQLCLHGIDKEWRVLLLLHNRLFSTLEEQSKCNRSSDTQHHDAGRGGKSEERIQGVCFFRWRHCCLWSDLYSAVFLQIRFNHLTGDWMVPN